MPFTRRSIGLSFFYLGPHQSPGEPEPTTTFRSSDGRPTFRLNKSTRRICLSPCKATKQSAWTTPPLLPLCPTLRETLILKAGLSPHGELVTALAATLGLITFLCPYSQSGSRS